MAMDSATQKLCAKVEEALRTYGVAGLDEGGGLLFEPRTLWDVQVLNVRNAVTGAIPTKLARNELQLSREKFRNGARWPIVITRLSLAAINYLLAANINGAGASSTNFRNATSVLTTAKFLLSVPNRQLYSAQPIVVGSLAMRPTADPLMIHTATPFASSLFGISRLEFDKHLRLPRNGAIEVYLGNYTAPSLNVNAVAAHISVEETGGLFPGAARHEEVAIGSMRVDSVPQFPPDAFGTAGQVPTVFSPASTFTANEFIKQRPSRGHTSASFTAINVGIDQRLYDDDIVTNLVAAPVSPLSLRVPTRIRTVGGGTGADWWEQGCPLALAFTEITPALVYDLPMPIVLNPGDTLNVLLQLPLDAINGESPVYPNYQIGVAANGFAVIEG